MTRRLLLLGFAVIAILAMPRVAQAQAHAHCGFFNGGPCPAMPRLVPGLSGATFGPVVFVKRPAPLVPFQPQSGAIGGHRHLPVVKEPLKAARPLAPLDPCGTLKHGQALMSWPCLLGPKK